MDKEQEIPFPIRFNVFKHHRNYILETLNGASSELIFDLLDSICNNYIDIYTGMMSPEAIGNAIIAILKSKGTFLKDDFIRWVSLKKGYQQIRLDDQSLWVVRISNESDRYIHIHPARTGPLTLRFKGSTLKTAYKLKTSFEGHIETISMENVNLIRNQIGLSPIKKLERSKGILNCYEKFFN
jgi:hypothetical protein